MEKIIFENLPSTNTPINANNLNQMQTNVENVFDGEVPMGNIVVENIKCKNLFNKNLYSLNYLVSNDISTNNLYYSVKIHLGEPNTDYYLQTEYINNYTSVGVSNMYVLMYQAKNRDWLAIGHTGLSIINGILTTDENGDVIIQVYKTLSKTDYENLMANSNIIITKGSTPTTYTPYRAYGIVESGTNENGSWIRYDDGTMICNAQLTYENKEFNQTSGSLYYCAEAPTWTYPKSFIDNNINIQVNCQFSNVNEIGGSNSWIVAKNQTNVFVWSTTNTTKTFTVHFKAIGRWK